MKWQRFRPANKTHLKFRPKIPTASLIDDSSDDPVNLYRSIQIQRTSEVTSNYPSHRDLLIGRVSSEFSIKDVESEEWDGWFKDSEKREESMPNTVVIFYLQE